MEIASRLTQRRKRATRRIAPVPERHIAIGDVASGKVTVVPNIPIDNCFGPVCSPDANNSLFQSWQKHTRTPSASAP
jgi:hypothetical protein